MKKWIAASDVSKMLNCNVHTVYKAASNGKWEHKMGKPPIGGGKRPKLYLSSDAMSWKKMLDSNKAGNGTNSAFGDILRLVKWADSLESYPSVAEIEKHTTFTYRVPDIVSVIENRVARGFAELKMA